MQSALLIEFVPVFIRILGELAVTNLVFVLKGQKLPLQRGGMTIEDAMQPTRQFRVGELRSLSVKFEGSIFTFGLLWVGKDLAQHLEAMKGEKLIDYELLPDGNLVLSRPKHLKIVG